MPLALVGRTKDAIVSVPAASRWQDGVTAFLSGLTEDEGKVARHLDLLEQRCAGRLPWLEVLSGATLPDGRPMPPARRYAEMLVEEDRLPLYGLGGLRFSLDLHNPGNEANATGYDLDQIELAIVADVGNFAVSGPGSVIDGSLSFEEQAVQRAAMGRLLGELVARLMESTAGAFAYADIASTLWPGNAIGRGVRDRDPSTLRPWDVAWSITAWGPLLLDDRLLGRIEKLEYTEEMVARVDRFERPHSRIERRRLATGGMLLQYRFLFGTELRSSRPAVDSPLAKQLGLLSTAILTPARG